MARLGRKRNSTQSLIQPHYKNDAADEIIIIIITITITVATERMPRKKTKSQTQAVPRRRVAVQDDDGWTHITNTRRVATTTKTTARTAATATATTTAMPDQLIPAEIPDGLTLSQLRAQFDAHQEKWLDSQTWKAIAASPIASSVGGSKDNSKFICIALGSPSGFLRGGLVDRRAVSLFQLAAFISLIDLLSPNTRTYLFFFLAFSLAFAFKEKTKRLYNNFKISHVYPLSNN
ncbi:conserved hypothetical protein [Trichophyton verrucosum HKI 0517]|uniref:Uncharacterized protein n=1 Tax=Trichophyton verrucosum (strain HKI 0517) TaxID=663202 RepID=D4DLF8_TRIVH|nr:uncharacterized protein TRV_08032 [Trichophyton verrucosum HKI 0517]EFE37336.1 conserved hypothetical protein [Trichophyton verrucosum HKI 0517]